MAGNRILFTQTDLQSPDGIERVLQQFRQAIESSGGGGTSSTVQNITQVSSLSQADIANLSSLIRSQLQVTGSTPLNLQSLLPAAGGIAVFTVDTHAARVVNYPPGNFAIGAAFFEFNRNSIYTVSLVGGSNAWVFSGGMMTETLSNRPTDLGSNDAGFAFTSTDPSQQTEYVWNGTGWETVGGVQQSITDAATNTITEALSITHRSTGTPAAGFGVGILYQLDNSVNTVAQAGETHTAWTSVVLGSETSLWAVQLANLGAALADYFRVLVSGIQFNVGGFFAKLTHANTADRIYTLPDAAGNLTYETAVLTSNNFLFGGGGALVKDAGFATVPILSGGTGGTTAATARTALSAAQIQAPGGPHTIPLAKLTGGGTNGSITFNAEGVVTAFVDPT